MERPRILLSLSPGAWGSYQEAVTQAGGEACGFYCPTFSPSYDGLILAGGDDMDPAFFHQENHGSKGIDPHRDRAELALTKAFLAAKKPILGICRGHQVLNIVLGGTLIQDMDPALAPFHRPSGEDGQDRVHAVRTRDGSLLHRLYGSIFTVNSYHHQALDQLGSGLTATAWSESGLVEAVEHRLFPVIGVQFHPERMSYGCRRPDTADGGPIFSWFLDQCREYHTPNE